MTQSKIRSRHSPLTISLEYWFYDDSLAAQARLLQIIQQNHVPPMILCKCLQCMEVRATIKERRMNTGGKKGLSMSES